MKQTTIPGSGIQIDNLLTMALQHRVRNRNRLQMTLLSVLGAFSSILTFITMFSPSCSIPVILFVTAVLTIFFCWHAEHAAGTHISMLLFMIGYVLLLILKRQYASNGMLHLLNSVYQTIHKTDWIYFEPDTAYPSELSVTILLCVIIVPILWLLSYAVVRYQNFFLSLLVTFPFIEIGLFFGIVPQHLPMAGLFAFWCGIGAAQLAGSSVFQKDGKAGFVRRQNKFFPVSGMRFLLTERAGIITAVIVMSITLLCDAILTAVQYERPEQVKQMRTNFQEYTASIDWNDLYTLIPVSLRSGSSNHAENKIRLGDVEQRQYDDVTVSKVIFSEPPQGHVYLKFSTYQEYSQNTWNRSSSDNYNTPVFEYLSELDIYPPEFLYYTTSQFNGKTIDMTLVDANKVLSKCIPYGFRKSETVHCIGDVVDETQTQTYTIYGGQEYEFMLLNSIYNIYSTDNLIDFLGTSYDTILREISDPEKEIFTIMKPEQNAAVAAIVSAGDYSDFTQTHYLNVPQSAEMETIRTQYEDLFAGYDAQSACPAETILLLQSIRDRLCSQVSYSLSPGKTPQSSDFVSYFLFENKKGYCTHYATASVLLARMAGIPARYCEGYLVDNERLEESVENGKVVYSAEILDSNAHAWCEVYLESIGWIPFEFTFSYFTEPAFTDAKPITEPISATEPPETETTIPQTTFLATTSTDNNKTPPSTEQHNSAISESQQSLKLVLILLGVFAVVLGSIMCLVLARYMALQRRTERMRDKTHGADYTWHWFLTLLHICGTNIDAHTATLLTESAHAACARHEISPDLLDAALQAGTRLRCSPHGLTTEEIEIIRKASRQLTSSLYKKANIFKKFHLKWIRHYL